MYFFQVNNEWLTEYCLICGSVNHIFLCDPEAHAWECWACSSRWWIDELAEDVFLIENDISEDEANDMLLNAHYLVTFLHGHCERVENE